MYISKNSKSFLKENKYNRKIKRGKGEKKERNED